MSKEQKKECFVFGNFSTLDKNLCKDMKFEDFRKKYKGIRGNVEEIFTSLGGKLEGVKPSKKKADNK